MDVTFRSKNFKLSDDVETHIRKRIERLPRHVDNVLSAEVILSQQPTHLNPQGMEYRVQLTLQTRNNLIRSEVCNAEVLTAVDQALDHLSRQVERQKARYDRKRRHAVGLGKSSADMAERGIEEELPLSITERGDGAGSTSPGPDAEEETGSIVRVKSFSVKPMFPEDAIDQMELLGHNFFVFRDAGDERISVLYKRNDGNYGLIQPDLS